jgi:cystathionine beta-lyase/cystathionine gamma-synthase
MGGAERLADHPMTTRHSEQIPAELATAGVTDDLMRISVRTEYWRRPLDYFMHVLGGG